MIFNERLKLLRIERSYTQEAAAKAIGIPPRSYQRLELDGNKTHYDTLMKIADFGVEKMVYIACKPTSLARDLELLQGRGYQVERMCCVDLFPGTYHIETVAELKRK